MKSLLIILTFILCSGFIHPMDFQESQKDVVINNIKKQVRKDYCEGSVDMCQDVTLRMMERENLNAFKKLTTAKHRKIMDRVIKDYCNSSVDMCNYVTILMMYETNLKASSQQLTW